MRLRAPSTSVLVVALFAACSGVSRDPEAHFRGEGGAGPGGASASAGRATGGTISTGGVSTGGSDAGMGGFAGELQDAAAGEGGSSGGMAGSAGESADGGVAGSGGVVSTGGIPATGGVAGASSGGSGNSAGKGNPDVVSKDALVYWFSGDFGVTEEDGMISQWLDRSGNEAHAEQPTAELRPRLGSFPYSGLPAAEFDGRDDYLALPSLEASFDEGLSFFAIARATNARLCMTMLELSNGSEIEDIGFLSFQQAFSYEVFEKIAQGTLGAFGIESNLLLDVNHTPEQVATVYINGTGSGSESLFPVPVNVTRTENFLGRSLYPDCLASWAGEIAELLLYARPIEIQEREAIRRYLSEKWGCCGG